MKNENLDSYTRPVFAFLTFENEAGYEVARKFSEDQNDDAQLLECKINIKEATEPTDIIWENRHYTEKQLRSNMYRVILNATMYLCGALLIITVMKGGLMMLTAKYPKANCALIAKQFGPKLEEFAFYEYTGFYDKTKNTKMTGVLQCFCEQDKPSWDMFSKEYHQFDAEQNKKLTAPICQSWYLETMTLKPFLAQVTQYTIIFLNNALRDLLVA